jgi:hypothetical protein
MQNYVVLDFGVWTKHGERGVVMEDDEEEEGVNNISDWTAGQAFANTIVGVLTKKS